MAYKILFDMDGILANYHGLVEKEFGITKHDYQTYLMVREKIAGTDFFSRIEPFPNLNYLIEEVTSTFGNFGICSAPLQLDNANSIKHKLLWLGTHFVKPPTEIHFLTDKWRVADQNTILIDDIESNIRKFTENNGKGILTKNDGTNEWVDQVVGDLVSIISKL